MIETWWKNIPKSSQEEKDGFPVEKVNIAYDISEYYQKMQKKSQAFL